MLALNDGVFLTNGVISSNDISTLSKLSPEPSPALIGPISPTTPATPTTPTTEEELKLVDTKPELRRQIIFEQRVGPWEFRWLSEPVPVPKRVVKQFKSQFWTMPSVMIGMIVLLTALGALCFGVSIWLAVR